MNRDSAFNDHFVSVMAALKLKIDDGAKESRAILKRSVLVVFILALPALVCISVDFAGAAALRRIRPP
jgi:hypothetical protein